MYLDKEFQLYSTEKLPFRNGAIKTITYGKVYIANGMTVTTMHVIETAGYKNFPEGHRKKLFRFFMFYNSEFLETYIDG